MPVKNRPEITIAQHLLGSAPSPPAGDCWSNDALLGNLFEPWSQRRQRHFRAGGSLGGGAAVTTAAPAPLPAALVRRGERRALCPPLTLRQPYRMHRARPWVIVETLPDTTPQTTRATHPASSFLLGRAERVRMTAPPLPAALDRRGDGCLLHRQGTGAIRHSPT